MPANKDRKESASIHVITDSSLSGLDKATASALIDDFCKNSAIMDLETVSKRAGVPMWLIDSIFNSVVAQIEQAPSQGVSIAMQFGYWLRERMIANGSIPSSTDAGDNDPLVNPTEL